MKFDLRKLYFYKLIALFVNTPRSNYTSDDQKDKNKIFRDQKELELFIQNLKDEAMWLSNYKVYPNS